MKVDKKDLNKLVVDYYENGEFPIELYNFVDSAAKHISGQNNFRNYPEIDEYINIAKFKVFHALITRVFNPIKGNIYSFTTTVIFNTFISEIKKTANKTKYSQKYYLAQELNNICEYQNGC